MRLQYLGTAAAEGWPALYCNCPNCRKAQKLGGRDIRTRSQALLDGHILLDFPPDTYLHKLQWGLDLSAVDLLLVTHNHSDHLYPQDLGMRRPPFSHDFTTPGLCVASGHDALDFIGKQLSSLPEGISLHPLEPFTPTELCGALVTAIPANHMLGTTSDPYCYAIETKGKRILYLHDTGEPIVSELEKLAGERPFDLISYDACYCDREADFGGHMGLPNVVRLSKRLKELKLCSSATVQCLNHFSHNTAITCAELEAAAKAVGMCSSYDGMVLEF